LLLFAKKQGNKIIDMAVAIYIIVALFTGFVGALDAGPITISVFQLSHLGGFRRSLPVLIGSFIPECILASLSFVLIRSVINNADPVTFRIMAYMLTFILACYAIYFIIFKEVRKSLVESPSQVESVGMGFATAIVNPRHFFFLLASFTVLVQIEFLTTRLLVIVLASVFCAIGTLFTHIIIGRIGTKIDNKKLVSFCILITKIHGLFILLLIIPVIYHMVMDVINN
jgi:threonine/homoserine/homoserine lactone efflux protein